MASEDIIKVVVDHKLGGNKENVDTGKFNCIYRGKSLIWYFIIYYYIMNFTIVDKIIKYNLQILLFKNCNWKLNLNSIIFIN